MKRTVVARKGKEESARLVLCTSPASMLVKTAEEERAKFGESGADQGIDIDIERERGKWNRRK